MINADIVIDCDVSLDEYVDEFTKWIESKGWHYGGGHFKTKEE